MSTLKKQVTHALSTNSMHPLESQITHALSTLNITPSPVFIEKITQYIEEFSRWNAIINLSARNEHAAIIEHITDSLSIHTVLRTHTHTQQTIADIGSGNGFPAIPLALHMPDRQFSLIESSTKRCAFLNNIIAILQLRNCTVLNAPVETLTHQYQCICTRAFTSWSKKIATHLARMLLPHGALIVYATANSPQSARIAAHIAQALPSVQHIPNPFSADTTRTYIIARQRTKNTPA